MHVEITIRLAPDDELARAVEQIARETLTTIGGDPENDSITVSVSQSATIMATQPPAAKPADEGGEA